MRVRFPPHPPNRNPRVPRSLTIRQDLVPSSTASGRRNAPAVPGNGVGSVAGGPAQAGTSAISGGRFEGSLLTCFVGVASAARFLPPRFWPRRLPARTPASHAGKRSSTLLGVTRWRSTTQEHTRITCRFDSCLLHKQSSWGSSLTVRQQLRKLSERTQTLPSHLGSSSNGVVVQWEDAGVASQRCGFNSRRLHRNA